MKKLFPKKLLFAILFIVLFLYSPVSPAGRFISTPAQASVFDAIKNNLNNFNQGAQLPKSDLTPEGIVINIINTALSFLGLIFVCLTLYAGFLYMTASGEKGKIEKAQNILKDAVIGIFIISIAYFIVNFVIITIIDLSKNTLS